MKLSTSEEAQLAAHRQRLSQWLQQAEEQLILHPEQALCPRQAVLLERLESAFAGQVCLPGISLLHGGLAEDAWCASAVVEHINRADDTPRTDWRSLSPQLLHACEDALYFVTPQAFCYVLPAYLRQYLLRPDYMCCDSIFPCLSHQFNDPQYHLNKLAPLTAAQKAVVEDVFNEYRWREIQQNGDCEDTLLPWEYERYLLEGGDASAWTFAGNLALEYAGRFGMA
ncbi:MAG: hypothetical protein IJN29_03405 [Akkermansia sp.]|nr:hypothetical protein [Akkermansia sp.]